MSRAHGGRALDESRALEVTIRRVARTRGDSVSGARAVAGIGYVAFVRWALLLLCSLSLLVGCPDETDPPPGDDDDSTFPLDDDDSVGDDDDSVGDDDDVADDDDSVGDDDDAADDDDSVGDDDDAVDDDDSVGDDDDSVGDDDDSVGDDDDSTAPPVPPLEFVSVTSGGVVTSTNYTLELYVAPAEPVGSASSTNYQLDLGPGAIRAAQ